MYFIYVSNDRESIEMLEKGLHRVDRHKLLITVANGFDLIEFLQNVKRGDAYPDLIILTSKFVRLSGKELLELLKTDDIYKLIPVVMMLGETNEDDAAHYRKLGTDAIVTPAIPGDWTEAAKMMCAACG